MLSKGGVVLDRFRSQLSFHAIPSRAVLLASLVAFLYVTGIVVQNAEAQTSTAPKSTTTAAPAKASPTSKSTTTHHTTTKHHTTTHHPATTTMPTMPPFFTGHPDTAGFRAMCNQELDLARQNLEKMLSIQGKRTIENTLVPFNLIMVHSDNAGTYSGLMEEVHPDSTFRSTAEEVSQAVSKFQSELSLNRAVYDALTEVNVTQSDPATKYFVKRTLRDFRLAGVDKDDATRKQIAAIRDELVLTSQTFNRNIRNDSRTIQVTAADLDGMPDDFLKSHAPGPDGKIMLSIEYPDLFPVMTYCKVTETRRRLQTESMNRAYPANMAVLDSMVAKRDRLAHLVGYSTWADYITADKMIGNAKNAADFIVKMGNLTREPAQQEYQVYLKRKREDVPNATSVDRWEARYYENLIHKRDYNYDAEAARPYFQFNEVRDGVLTVTSKMFGVTFKKIANADVWDPSVEAYEIWEGNRLLGRFFLDLHPRAGKYNHAAQFGIRVGVAGIQLPEAALICNFPGGTPGDPGLMEHDDVVTFFHEFGHLLHSIFGGHQRWEPISGISTEQDFVEAPSQMLEEWPKDLKVLQSFAKNYQTGQPIPAEMVQNMRRADVFPRAVDNAFQDCFSAISLNLYNQDPRSVNSDSVTVQALRSFTPFPVPSDTHFQCAFGHLDNYSAVYYTYVWSLVIAKDLFSHFDHANLLAPGAATRYRHLVLEPGGSMPAAQLVHNFLGRDFNTKAYEAWLKAKE